ncbi:hypothetical protein F4778DRAFT_266914 [Xylariomycetidae sp. FL2044]|nr:hypothetical protein F4778DRAFT_266914 [Xylariomycetidae sp. FL2044]
MQILTLTSPEALFPSRQCQVDLHGRRQSLSSYDYYRLASLSKPLTSKVTHSREAKLNLIDPLILHRLIGRRKRVWCLDSHWKPGETIKLERRHRTVLDLSIHSAVVSVLTTTRYLGNCWVPERCKSGDSLHRATDSLSLALYLDSQKFGMPRFSCEAHMKVSPSVADSTNQVRFSPATRSRLDTILNMRVIRYLHAGSLGIRG